MLHLSTAIPPKHILRWFIIYCLFVDVCIHLQVMITPQQARELKKIRVDAVDVMPGCIWDMHQEFALNTERLEILYVVSLRLHGSESHVVPLDCSCWLC